ncbi:cytochrome P450 [Mycena pura]|uniref:Cytochrome P450 n=1 Tax=Mycena pura TaxID=153505 RepID=A0AAD6XZK7_9AGAR|nr:cytochrome P450 [Mycena pura]
MTPFAPAPATPSAFTPPSSTRPLSPTASHSSLVLAPSCIFKNFGPRYSRPNHHDKRLLCRTLNINGYLRGLACDQPVTMREQVGAHCRMACTSSPDLANHADADGHCTGPKQGDDVALGRKESQYERDGETRPARSRDLHNEVSMSKLPPGPRGYPVIGSLFSISPTKPWVTFTKWRDIYVPTPSILRGLLSFQYGGPFHACVELPKKRHGPVGKAFLQVLRSTPVHRGRRGNLILGFMRSNDVYLLAESLIQSPQLWNEHLKRSATSLIMAVVYGAQRLARPDPENITSQLPRWMSAWRRDAEVWFAKDEGMFENFYDEVQDRMGRGDERKCVVTNLIEQQQSKNLSHQESVWLAGTMYAAGSDLVGFCFSAATMSWWMIAMVAYPCSETRARRNGQGCRTFSYAHFRGLRCVTVYAGDGERGTEVEACSTAWGMHGRNHTPTVVILINSKVPHRLIEEYLIPKKEGHCTYGFGRRICVGRHVANHNLWSQFASVVWACDIQPLKSDANGNLPDIFNVESDMVMLPAPFECDIKPRFPGVKAVLEEAIETDNYGQI